MQETLQVKKGKMQKCRILLPLITEERHHSIKTQSSMAVLHAGHNGHKLCKEHFNTDKEILKNRNQNENEIAMWVQGGVQGTNLRSWFDRLCPGQLLRSCLPIPRLSVVLPDLPWPDICIWCTIEKQLYLLCEKFPWGAQGNSALHAEKLVYFWAWTMPPHFDLLHSFPVCQGQVKSNWCWRWLVLPNDKGVKCVRSRTDSRKHRVTIQSNLN